MEPVWLVNGERVGVDPRDRGLAYGDGLFETMACRDGRIRWLDYHLDRLTSGCGRLAMPIPDRAVLTAEIRPLLPEAGNCVVKLVVTRGVGERGYRVPEPAQVTRIVSISSWPEQADEHYTQGVSLQTCVLRLGENPQLAGLKHLCRLEQVLAYMELTGSTAYEGLLRDSSGRVISGISSNIFAVRGDELATPRLTRCGVGGVMRRVVIEHAADAGLAPIETDLDVPGLLASDEVFITNAVIGIKPVAAIDQARFPVGMRTQALMRRLGYGRNHDA